MARRTLDDRVRAGLAGDAPRKPVDESTGGVLRELALNGPAGVRLQAIRLMYEMGQAQESRKRSRDALENDDSYKALIEALLEDPTVSATQRVKLLQELRELRQPETEGAAADELSDEQMREELDAMLCAVLAVIGPDPDQFPTFAGKITRVVETLVAERIATEVEDLAEQRAEQLYAVRAGLHVVHEEQQPTPAANADEPDRDDEADGETDDPEPDAALAALSPLLVGDASLTPEQRRKRRGRPDATF